MECKEEDFLQLSGLQHFAFCRRQWALIHLEQQWAENLRTTDGELMHARAHEVGNRERRGDLLITRGMYIHSSTLGVAGQCDVVEFHRAPKGVPLVGQEGLWRPYPIEYKRGAPKEHNADALQLCGQALCLEEMLCCEIPVGALFYGQTRRRQEIVFTAELRAQVREMLSQMHELYRRGHTPKVKPTKSCNACSLRELCLPALMKPVSAASYLRDATEEL
ncbi:MAG: CRISPR-associated protein Cas4 [Faecousia sp.]